MTTPYRESCQKCPELNEEIQDLKNKVESEQKKNRVSWSQHIASVVILGAIVFVMTIVGASAYGCAMKPDAPDLCQDRAEIITHSDNVRLCHPDSTLLLEKLNESQMLMKCVCPHTVK